MKSLKQRSAMKVLLVAGGLVLGLGATYAFSQTGSKLADELAVKLGATFNAGSTVDNEKVVIKDDGSVGIGTVTPTEKLMVNGNTKVGDTSSTGTVFMQLLGHHDVNGGSGFRLQFDRSKEIFGIARELSGFQEPSLTIARGTGNVGIGTSIPAGKMDIRWTGDWDKAQAVVFSTIGQNPSLRLYRPTGGVATDAYPWRIENTVGDLQFQTGAVAGIGGETVAPVFTIKPNGNVGTGTATPEAKLDVSSSAISGDTQIGRFAAVGSTSGIAYTTFGSDPGGYAGWDYTLGGLSLNAHSAGGSSSGIFVKRINNGASNVGIGTTNPLSKLSVGGDGFANMGVTSYGTSSGVYGVGGTGVFGLGTSYGVHGQGYYGVVGTANDSNGYSGYFSGGRGVYLSGNLKVTGTVTADAYSIGSYKYAYSRAINAGEDVYGGHIDAYAADTCNGDSNNYYSCTTNDERTCTDAYNGALAYDHRTVYCYVNYILTTR